MADIRNNLNWIAGITVGGIAAAVSWVVASGLFATLIGVVIGAGVTYAVQTKTQKTIWKREHSIQVSEKVYGALFGELKSIITTMEKKNHIQTRFIKWQEAQSDHRYFMVDKKFREKLDAFKKRLDTHADAVSRLDNGIIKDILRDTAVEVFKAAPEHNPSLVITYKEGTETASLNTDFSYYIKKDLTFAELIDLSLYSKGKEIQIIQVKVHYQKPKQAGQFESDNRNNIEKYWELCRQKLSSTSEYRLVTAEKPVLTEEARKLMDELCNRIEEPWKT